MARRIVEENKLEPGWLERQMRESIEEFESYPKKIQDWMRAFGQGVRPNPEGDKEPYYKGLGQ